MQKNKLKLKQILLISLPPLLTILLIAYGYYRYKKTNEEKQNSKPEKTFTATDHEQEELSKDQTQQEKTNTALTENNIPASTDESAAETSTLENSVLDEKLDLLQAEKNILALASSLSDSPLWQKCLSQSRPLQRFVAAIDSIAMGERPLEALDFLHSSESFSAKKTGTSWIQSQQSQERYTLLVQMTSKIPVKAAAKLFLILQPALQEACNNLGYRDKTIKTLLTEACTTILTVPVLGEDAALIPGIKENIYYWQSAELEELNDAQKLFLRLGKNNSAKMREYIEKIASELQLYKE